MNANRREYDNNIYIKTKLCIYIFLYIYIQYRPWHEARLIPRTRAVTRTHQEKEA